MGKRSRRMAAKAAHHKKKEILVHGEFSAAAAGFGFVNPAEGKAVFIPPSMVNGALDGDTVAVDITDDHDPRGPVGRIREILHRGRKFVVGMLTGEHEIQPLDRALSQNIKISGSIKGARRGDWVKTRLLDNGSKHTEKLSCAVEETIGRSATVTGDLHAVEKEFDMIEPYSAKQEEAAEELVPLELPRTDLTKEITVTIDPADAHDFDDAISIIDEEKEWVIGVHIADLATLIRPGMAFDKQAAKRGFSSYIPLMFRPMLPRTLTHKASLTEDAVSPAHTVRLHVRKYDGKITAAERLHTRIKVNRRLDYDEVQAVMDGAAAPKRWGKRVENAIQLLIKAVGKMRKYRKKKELFLEIDTAEARIHCNEETFEVESIEMRRQRPADTLVEECMLAANTAVAEEMIRKEIPAVFRVHPEPDFAKIEEFTEFAEKILHRKIGDLSDRSVCDEFLKSLPHDQQGIVLNQLFLQAMQRARYQEEPALHFGLGKLNYLHFTSPIRRYSDLLVHQQLLAHDTNTRKRSRKLLAEIANTLTKKEISNDEAYYAACDRLKLHYLKRIFADESGTMYEAVIVKMNSGGLICDIPQYGIRGFVPNRLMRIRFRKPPKAGDVIYLYLDSLDFQRGTALFRPAL